MPIDIKLYNAMVVAVEYIYYKIQIYIQVGSIFAFHNHYYIYMHHLYIYVTKITYLF